MHPEDIKAAVRKTGTTLTALALQAGLPEHACRRALRQPYFMAERAIAEHLGLSPRQIWPQRYRADGTTKHPPRHRFAQSNAASAEGHRQKTEAA